jgi:hypothetical protein
VEDGDRTLVGKKSAFSWKGKGKGKKPDRSSWMGAKQGMNDSPVDTVEMGTRPATLSGLPFSENGSPHRYPPTPRHGSPRPSMDASNEGGDTLLQAAKVIKSAVLHDARNIQGKSEGLASMAWNVSSAHEAKVRISPPYSSRDLCSYIYVEHSVSLVLSTQSSRTGGERTSSLPIFILRFPSKRRQKQHFGSSIRTTTGISPEARSKLPSSRFTRNAGFSRAPCVMSALH